MSDEKIRQAQNADFLEAQQSAETLAQAEAEKVQRRQLTMTQMKALAKATLEFCEQISGLELYPYERQFGHRVILSLLLNDASEITALFSRQSGKTETIATVVSGMLIILPALGNAFEDTRIARFGNGRGVRIGIYGPNKDRAKVMYKRIQTKVFSKRTKTLVRSDPSTFGFSLDNLKGRALELPNGSICEAHTARPNADIEGETWDLIICEEAQALDTMVVKKSIHPMGAATAATRVKIGTPAPVKCEFLDCIERNKKLDARGGSGHLQLHFEYDCDVAAKYNAQYARYLRSERISLGEDSDEFRMAYKLEWLLERGMFMPPELVHSMRIDVTVTPSDRQNLHVVGIDFGKSGSHTVVTVMRIFQDTVDDVSIIRKVVVNWKELSGAGHEEQFPQIVQFIRNFRVLRVAADATGVGDPIVSRLAATLKVDAIKVIPVVFGSVSKDSLYRDLEKEIQAGRVKVCASPHSRRMKKFQKFEEQMEGLVREFRGNYMLVHKDDDDPKAQDDYPDSLALASWAARTLLDGVTKHSEQGIFKTRTSSRGIIDRGRRSQNALIGPRSGRRIPQW